MESPKKYAPGDLVRIPHLPRKEDTSSLWTPDPAGEHVGIVIKEQASGNWRDILVGQILVVEISTGELVTLSSNLVELLD